MLNKLLINWRNGARIFSLVDNSSDISQLVLYLKLSIINIVNLKNDVNKLCYTKRKPVLYTNHCKNLIHRINNLKVLIQNVENENRSFLIQQRSITGKLRNTTCKYSIMEFQSCIENGDTNQFGIIIEKIQHDLMVQCDIDDIHDYLIDEFIEFNDVFDFNERDTNPVLIEMYDYVINNYSELYNLIIQLCNDKLNSQDKVNIKTFHRRLML